MPGEPVEGNPRPKLRPLLGEEVLDEHFERRVRLRQSVVRPVLREATDLGVVNGADVPHRGTRAHRAAPEEAALRRARVHRRR